jgi:histidinol-phosphatase (PHP family)
MVFKAEIDRVSIHGGHSGQFCCHAKDSLEAIIKAYIQKGFVWVGITEHMPPTKDLFLYPDERALGFNIEKLRLRFDKYIKTCQVLRKKYLSKLCIYVGFETEAYTGAANYAIGLRSKYKPDFIVGSVHHVNDIPFDMGPDQYAMALRKTGGYEQLYAAYFDRQYELLRALKPEVVGHFDLIRIFDVNYLEHLLLPLVWNRICRNLELIRTEGLILDYNLKALSKGAMEPYVAAPILKQALSMGIALVPGDDSHGVDSVARHYEEGIETLIAFGASTDWLRPVDVKNSRNASKR